MNKSLEKHSLPKLTLETENLDRTFITTKQLTMYFKNLLPTRKSSESFTDEFYQIFNE